VRARAGIPKRIEKSDLIQEAHAATSRKASLRFGIHVQIHKLMGERETHLIKRYDFISANKSPAALGQRILINTAARKNCNRS
jgi:hypothetical protein